MGSTKYWWQWITSAPAVSRKSPAANGVIRSRVRLFRITRSYPGFGVSRTSRGPKLTSFTAVRSAIVRASSSAKRSPPPRTDSGAK